MAPQLLIDLSTIDLDHVAYDAEAIEAINPQRGAMRQLDGICYIDDNNSEAVGFKEVGSDEFWVAGHLPDRPLLPGVLMIESAAQLAAFLMKQRYPDIDFLGFVGCDQIKFREQVPPGRRLYVLGREVQLKRRRFICDAQGVVDGGLVFEGRITGMPL